MSDPSPINYPILSEITPTPKFLLLLPDLINDFPYPLSGLFFLHYPNGSVTPMETQTYGI